MSGMEILELALKKKRDWEKALQNFGRQKAGHPYTSEATVKPTKPKNNTVNPNFKPRNNQNNYGSGWGP